jgi:high frequency lysogenization protein
MSNNINRQKTLALAAIFQAAALADNLARRGTADIQAIKVLLDSIIVFDTDNPEAIYGSPKQLMLGLRSLEGCLTIGGFNDNENYANQLQYALGIIQLESQLSKSDKLLNTLRSRLEQTQKQLPHFDNDISAQGMINNFAGAYIDTIGTLRFRLQIKGNQQKLQTAGIPEQVRAVLLAGIRAAWLWKRLGGRRWHLLLTRGQILEELRVLIKEVR